MGKRNYATWYHKHYSDNIFLPLFGNNNSDYLLNISTHYNQICTQKSIPTTNNKRIGNTYQNKYICLTKSLYEKSRVYTLHTIRLDQTGGELKVTST